ncbi:MAG: nucleoside-triphosphatase [Candidatus Thermoplasmatota archaeon]
MKILMIGAKNSGKSTTAYNIFKNSDCCGIICLPVFKNGIKIGSDAIRMDNKKRIKFSRTKRYADFEGIKVGKYVINKEGIKFCINAIDEGIRKRKLVVIDEFGILEKNKKGLYRAIKRAIESENDLFLILRKSLEKDFLKIFPYDFEIIYKKKMSI